MKTVVRSLNRHQECVVDGVSKLFSMAKMMANDGLEIVSCEMGLHVYNVMVTAHGHNSDLLQTEDIESKNVSFEGVPVTISGEDQNSMPHFTFRRVG